MYFFKLWTVFPQRILAMLLKSQLVTCRVIVCTEIWKNTPQKSNRHQTDSKQRQQLTLKHGTWDETLQGAKVVKRNKGKKKKNKQGKK